MTVYAYRAAHVSMWDACRLYSRACKSALQPTLDMTKALATARLGTMQAQSNRSRRLYLTDVGLSAYSAAEEGAVP